MVAQKTGKPDSLVGGPDTFKTSPAAGECVSVGGVGNGGAGTSLRLAGARSAGHHLNRFLISCRTSPCHLAPPRLQHPPHPQGHPQEPH